MQEEEKRLKEEVKRLLEQAEAADAEEDARYGRDRRGDELPAELARRETRLKRIREAKRALEERAREQAKSKGEAEEKAKPKGQMQYNFTDPESRIMPGADGFVQAYNAQIAVEPDFQLIVGQRVTQASNDKQQLKPTVEAIAEQAGQKPQEVLTDSGYCSDANLKYLEKKKIEGFIATDRESYRGRQQPGPRGPLPQEATRVDRMRRKLQTKAGGGDLLQTQNDRGAGVWTDQTSARLPAISLAWSGEGARGVGRDLSHAQHSEVTPALLWIDESKKGHT